MRFGLLKNNMKILVVIGNYGLSHFDYLNRLINEMKLWPGRVDIVIHTDVPLGIIGVQEKIVNCPPIKILLSTRETIFNNYGKYDLYIFTENDNLITWHNIESWIKCTKKVKLPYIVGFFQYEEYGDKIGIGSPNQSPKMWYPSHHLFYNWEEETAFKKGKYILCHHTNLHQASYVLNNELLGYVMSHTNPNPWTGENHPSDSPNIDQHYGPLERANADVFNTPGIKKVIPISHLKDFLIWHQPNKYRDYLGTPSDDMNKIIKVIVEAIQNKELPKTIKKGIIKKCGLVKHFKK